MSEKLKTEIRMTAKETSSRAAPSQFRLKRPDKHYGCVKALSSAVRDKYNGREVKHL